MKKSRSLMFLDVHSGEERGSTLLFKGKVKKDPSIGSKTDFQILSQTFLITARTMQVLPYARYISAYVITSKSFIRWSKETNASYQFGWSKDASKVVDEGRWPTPNKREVCGNGLFTQFFAAWKWIGLTRWMWPQKRSFLIYNFPRCQGQYSLII